MEVEKGKKTKMEKKEENGGEKKTHFGAFFSLKNLQRAEIDVDILYSIKIGACH